MAELPKKMTAVFEKYEAMDPDSWKITDFERDIIAISGRLANYQNAKSAIQRAHKLGVFPNTVDAYIQKHTNVHGNPP